MVYHYLTAYSIRGLSGASLPNDIRLVEVKEGDLCVQAVLTAAPDLCLDLADRGLALGHVMMKWMLTKEEIGGFPACLAEEVASIRAERSRRHAGCAVLVIETIGSTEVNVDAQVVDRGEFAFCLDAVDKESIRLRSKHIVNSIAAGLHLALARSEPMEQISGGVYLLDENARVIYPLTFNGSATLSVSSPCTDGMAALAKRYAEALVSNPGLSRVSRLLIQSLDAEADPFRAFVSAWTALEVLITSTFSGYYKWEFVEWLRECSPGPSWDEFLTRATDVMEGKYSLRDKCNVVSHFLGGSSAAEDRASFQIVKCARDKFVHGEDIADEELPLGALQSLLIRYLAAHLIGASV